MDTIFKALADPTRRAILDLLRQRDGRTLQELEQGLSELGDDAPSMTRFGVMSHLKVLEGAALVIPRKSGRFKHHYLNAVPLQQIQDRWIDPFIQQPMARAALELKQKLERHQEGE